MTTQNLADLVPRLEQRIGLRPGFFDSLEREEESDWSFVVKAHALVEAAVSHLLTEHLQHPELADLFSRLDISNKSTGKSAFVKALGLLEEPQRRFISSLSELRNKLVHDVRNVDFELDAFVQGMNQKDFQTFLKNFNLLSTETTNDINNIFRLDPRQALWYSTMSFLGLVYLRLSS